MEVLRDRKKMGLVYHRLLLVMSICDVILSSLLFLSSWPIPSGTPNVYGAIGNTATCSAQGFFIQIAAVSQLYNAYLAIYFLLIIRYSWSETQIKKLEPYVHGFSFLFAFGTASAGLALKLFNSANTWCWIAPFPVGCNDGRRLGAITCERGRDAWIYRFVFYYVWLWLAIATVTVAMFLVFWTVHKNTKKMRRYASLGQYAQKKRRDVAWQSFWYVCAFYFTNLFNTMLRLMQHANYAVPFSVVLLLVIFAPMQGGWNLLIYLRPRYLKYKEKNPDWKIADILKRSMQRALSGSSSNDDEEDDDDYRLGAAIIDEAGQTASFSKHVEKLSITLKELQDESQRNTA